MDRPYLHRRECAFCARWLVVVCRLGTEIISHDDVVRRFTHSHLLPNIFFLFRSFFKVLVCCHLRVSHSFLGSVCKCRYLDLILTYTHSGGGEKKIS